MQLGGGVGRHAITSKAPKVRVVVVTPRSTTSGSDARLRLGNGCRPSGGSWMETNNRQTSCAPMLAGGSLYFVLPPGRALEHAHAFLELKSRCTGG